MQKAGRDPGLFVFVVPAKAGPIGRALSIGCGEWIPGASLTLARDDSPYYFPAAIAFWHASHTFEGVAGISI